MDSVFSGLSLIIVIGALVALIMRMIGQPLIIGHILTGVIVGPALFHVLKDPTTLTVFGNMGIALLLFIIGLGMNPKIIKEVGRPSVIVGVSQVIVITILGYIVAGVLGFNHTESWFIGIGLSINSTIVALKLLTDRREQGRLYGKLTIGASLVDDIVAAIALLFVASAHNGHLLTFGPLLALTFKGLIIGYVIYWVTTTVLPKIHHLIAADQEMLFLFAIGWGLGCAALLAKAGFSLEVGALAGGVSLATLPYSQEIASRLRPLRDFFVIVFFIALGTQLSFSGFGSIIPTLLLATLIVVVVKPIIIMAIFGYLGYTKRTSFKTAIALSQVSEFSIILVILGVQQHLIGQHIVTLLTFIALISIAISTYLVTFGDRMYSKLAPLLSMFERRATLSDKALSTSYELILFGFQKGGHEFVRVFKQISKNYVVVDYDPDVIDDLEVKKINHLYGDVTDIELLEEIEASKAKMIVSTITDLEANLALLNYIKHKHSNAVVITEADNPHEAHKLYEHGATYVVLPHFIGSEKIGAFVKKSGLQKSNFKRAREAHIKYLKKHHPVQTKEQHHKKMGHHIVGHLAALHKIKA